MKNGFPDEQETIDLKTLSVEDIKSQLASQDITANWAILDKLRTDTRKSVRKFYLSLKRKADRQNEEKSRIRKLFFYEEKLWGEGVRLIAGVDEVGVGPLAGPVVAAAVIFPPRYSSIPVNDSKVLSPHRRKVLGGQIKETALGIGIGVASPEEIDRLNVYQASLLAMSRALGDLGENPEHVLVDARRVPGLSLPQTSIVKGDSKSFTIAAASIVAKIHRDKLMDEWDSQFPLYGFRNHKGYPTAAHREAIRKLGPCPIHRRSFRLIGAGDVPQLSLFSGD
jgi:ribonuclease HII